MTQPSVKPKGRTKPRAREHNATTTNVKPSLTTLKLSIINGPDREELYHESQFCLDGTSGSTYRSKFLISESQYVRGNIGACVMCIEHVPDTTHEFKLRGTVNICLIGNRKYAVYPFSATYNAYRRSGSIRIRVPLTDLPTP